MLSCLNIIDFIEDIGLKLSSKMFNYETTKLLLLINTIYIYLILHNQFFF